MMFGCVDVWMCGCVMNDEANGEWGTWGLTDEGVSFHMQTYV